ncbi:MULTISPECIES: pilus assembly protein PilO [Ramlibacter]|uniref:Pilus assembly protein PilO n=1 Tax=Ramlibacter pinisoli TaxID=2682844 RepID=A0A6N8IXP4_9BURK|nr:MULTISPECIES: pilus assembly protein PilO [Ramlibacter]MBA2961847.1 pilus assembly protein PilO [Ramlibacter sp. CGMCC 1.13660]MVQ31789.1 pilus assembly protein PilO [Ramlibacter pinisoli]
MRVPRLAAAEFLRALRWPGAAGALLAAASLAWTGAVLLPAQARLAAGQEQLARAERRAAAVRSGLASAPQSAATRRKLFYGALPAMTELTQNIDRIYAAAATEQLSLVRGEYMGAEIPAAGLVRYKIVLPLKGTYPQVRRFAAACATGVPGLSLDDLSLQRQSIADAKVDARVQMSIYVAVR